MVQYKQIFPIVQGDNVLVSVRIPITTFYRINALAHDLDQPVITTLKDIIVEGANSK